MRRFNTTLATGAIVALLAGLGAASAAETHGHGPGHPTALEPAQDMHRPGPAEERVPKGEMTGRQAANMMMEMMRHGQRGSAMRYGRAEGLFDGCDHAMVHGMGGPGDGDMSEHMQGMDRGPDRDLMMKRPMEEIERHMEWMAEHMKEMEGLIEGR